jgi:uncharacterized protein YggU (UPF0235/DUF167 family)
MYIKVKVEAGAKKEEVEKLAADSYKVAVKEPAERNLANKRVIELIAREYKVPTSGMHILHGHHAPSKLLSVYVTEE